MTPSNFEADCSMPLRDPSVDPPDSNDGAPDLSARGAFPAAIITAILLWGVMIWIGIGSGVEFTVDRSGGVHHPWSEYPAILANNGAAALGLFSGVVTFGLSTLALTVLLGLFTGAVFSGAAAALGADGAAQVFMPYFIFEGLGLVVATVAGILPLAKVVTSVVSPGRKTFRRVWAVYLSAIGQTVGLVALSAALLAIGAALEIAGGLPL